MTQLAILADELQPARAGLGLFATGCPGGRIKVVRMHSEEYQWWNDAPTMGAWYTREEFRAALEAEAAEWNACRQLDLYFMCTRGVDTDFGPNSECGDSVVARQSTPGVIELSAVTRHRLDP